MGQLVGYIADQDDASYYWNIVLFNVSIIHFSTTLYS